MENEARIGLTSLTAASLPGWRFGLILVLGEAVGVRLTVPEKAVDADYGDYG